MTLRHVVSWKLSGPTREERDAQAALAMEAIDSLRDTVPSVRALSVHRNELFDGSNADITLIADFDDAEGLASYASHPSHLPVIELMRGIVLSRAACDFTIPPADPTSLR